MKSRFNYDVSMAIVWVCGQHIHICSGAQQRAQQSINWVFHCHRKFPFTGVQIWVYQKRRAKRNAGMQATIRMAFYTAMNFFRRLGNGEDIFVGKAGGTGLEEYYYCHGAFRIWGWGGLYKYCSDPSIKSKHCNCHRCENYIGSTFALIVAHRKIYAWLNNCVCWVSLQNVKETRLDNGWTKWVTYRTIGYSL